MPIPAGPSPTLPDWAPDLQRVAAYIPRRTHVGATSGWGQIHSTFTSETRPTDAQVSSTILAACNWVLMATGGLHESLHESGADLAAMRAAGLVALTWPDNREEIKEEAETLLREAAAMRKDLAAYNISLTEDDPQVDEAKLLPVWSFPDAAAEVTW